MKTHAQGWNKTAASISTKQDKVAAPGSATGNDSTDKNKCKDGVQTREAKATEGKRRGARGRKAGKTKSAKLCLKTSDLVSLSCKKVRKTSSCSWMNFLVCLLCCPSFWHYVNNLELEAGNQQF